MKKKIVLNLMILLSFMATSLLSGCGGGGSNGGSDNSGITVTVNPSTVTLAPLGTQKFTATVTGASNTQVTWRVEEPDGGTIDNQGNYQAPNKTGDFHVIATSVADTTKSAKAAVHVVSGGGGENKPYYSGTITLDRTGRNNGDLFYDEHEEFSVIRLEAKNEDYTVWMATGSTKLTVKGSINNTVYDQENKPHHTITTNGWKDPVAGDYQLVITFDKPNHKLILAAGPFKYNCTKMPSGDPVENFIFFSLIGVIKGELPINTSQLIGSTTIDPESNGSKLIISWNLTLHLN